jgi:hypothetical protein
VINFAGIAIETRRRLRALTPWVLALVCANAHAIEFGVNIHYGETPEINAGRAAVMKERNFRTARMDLVFDKEPGKLRDQVQRIRANGGTVEAVVMTSHLWDHSCNQDLAAVESKAFRETFSTVDRVKDLVQDFELLNETDLSPEVVRELPKDIAGWSTAPYEGKPCVASTAAALRGMSHAIREVRASSGLPLRILFGQSARSWGFLRFMQRQGVDWDVTTWHIYSGLHEPSLLTGSPHEPGGPLAQLAALGKPVHVNEFNCSEIFQDSYENEPGRPLTEACLQSFANHLRELVDQKVANIESIHVYELLDESFKDAPENRFGLMRDLGHPKPHLLLYTAFAGGYLTQQERCEIAARGLMTEDEIDARHRARSPAAPLAPAVRCAPLRSR